MAWNPYTIWLIFTAVIGLMLFIAVLLSQMKERKKKEKSQGKARAPADDSGGPVGRRRVRNARNRMNAARHRLDEDDDLEETDEEEDGSFPMAFDNEMPTGKIGAKKLKRMEMKAEKRAMNEQMIAEREDRKERQAMQEKERKMEEGRRKREQEKFEEEEQIRKEEEEKKAYEEYLAMKEAFSIEEEGIGETVEENQALLQDFVNYIKKTKVVMLEDLACQFGLRTQDAIDRLQSLQELERITGVIDDRGKFIYISTDELEAVAKFIKQRGRITISDLAESSNKLINLQSAEGEVEVSA